MKNTPFGYFFALIPLTCFFGCGSDSQPDAPTPQEPCAQDVCSENGMIRIKCDAKTGETSEEYCKNGCKNGVCIELGKKCAQDICADDGKTLIKCDAETGAATEENCPYGCNNNACADKPAPDSDPDPDPDPTKCDKSACAGDGMTLRKCDAQTGIASEEYCAFGCIDAACHVPSFPCKNVCANETTLSVCDKTTGEASAQNCPEGCQKGACIAQGESKSYEVGAACDAAEFSEFCDGAAAVICDAGNVVAATDCALAAGMRCAALPNFYGAGIDRAGCYGDDAKCDIGNERQICIDYENISISGRQICFRSRNGEFYYDWDIAAAAVCRNDAGLVASCADAYRCGVTPIVKTCETQEALCSADLGYAGCAELPDMGAVCYAAACGADDVSAAVCASFSQNGKTAAYAQKCLKTADGRYVRVDVRQCETQCDEQTGMCI